MRCFNTCSAGRWTRSPSPRWGRPSTAAAVVAVVVGGATPSAGGPAATRGTGRGGARRWVEAGERRTRDGREAGLTTNQDQADRRPRLELEWDPAPTGAINRAATRARPARRTSKSAGARRRLQVLTTAGVVAAAAEVTGTRMRPAGLALIALWAIAGCATVPAWPAKGGPIWREAISTHFRLRSDLDEDDARETIRRLEEIRASMLALVWPGAPDPPIRTEVVVLRASTELMVFVRDPHDPPLIAGLRAERSPLPASLLFAGTDLRTMSTLVHELAHDLSEWFLPIQPLWYS